MNKTFSVGDICQVRIEKLIYGGNGLARVNERVVFVPNAAPEDLVEIRITEIERNFLRAEIVEIVEPSPTRRKPPCQYAEKCGGCQLQQIDYKTQLAVKADFIRDALSRIAHINWPSPIEVKHSQEFGYRSRAQFKIDRNSSPLQIGFYKADSHEVCDVDSCPILTPNLNNALQTLRSNQEEIATSKIPYSKIEVASGDNSATTKPYLSPFSDRVISQNVGKVRYKYSAGCFFQVNSLLLETLVETVLSGRSGNIAVDLYAGVGLFALHLAGRYKQVLATEVDQEAASWAVENIKSNRLQNIEFSSLSAERWLSQFTHPKRRAKIKINPELVVLDPPRAGASKKVLDSLVEIAPKEIVYVSCEPPTLARDLNHLINNGYRLETITGIDLFPQSYHIETVATLKSSSIF
ncbi:MAG: class I SAM-dependent RNA methyltransferase [Blastocatellia bacterium]|nr:class I SAM-dependent RNA methyltransferase [Blastocatellia bacterium]